MRGTSEKTIMLVGATGSGKTTLLDGIVNYITGVSFDDPFRFTLVQQEEEEVQVNYQVLCVRFPNQSSVKRVENFYKKRWSLYIFFKCLRCTKFENIKK